MHFCVYRCKLKYVYVHDYLISENNQITNVVKAYSNEGLKFVVVHNVSSFGHNVNIFSCTCGQTLLDRGVGRAELKEER